MKKSREMNTRCFTADIEPEGESGAEGRTRNEGKEWTGQMKKISFVIPCYRSEHTLPHVIEEIEEKMESLGRYQYDIFLVNDCSPDDTLGTIRRLCGEHDNIRGIDFAKNFGQHSALMAGLRYSDGDYMVCLDDDGQTPANEVDRLL